MICKPQQCQITGVGTTSSENQSAIVKLFVLKERDRLLVEVETNVRHLYKQHIKKVVVSQYSVFLKDFISSSSLYRSLMIFFWASTNTELPIESE